MYLSYPKKVTPLINFSKGKASLILFIGGDNEIFKQKFMQVQLRLNSSSKVED
jgi:hypothetical protein